MARNIRERETEKLAANVPAPAGESKTRTLAVPVLPNSCSVAKDNRFLAGERVDAIRDPIRPLR